MSNIDYIECPIEEVLSIKSLYTFFHRKLPKDYTFKGESHDFHEVLLVLSGELGVTANKNVYLLPAGQAIFHRGGEFHSLWSSPGAEPEIVVFSFAASVFPFPERTLFSLSPVQMKEILTIFSMAKDAFIFEGEAVRKVAEGKTTDAAAVVKRLELFLLSLFGETKEVRLGLTGRSAENYARIVSVLEEHLAEDLSAAQIASLCSLSIPALNKTVAKFAGCGVMSYYNSLRLKKAEELLLSGASVKEAAYSVGFFNQNYFSACFKKHTGIAPSRVKNM